MSMVYSRECKTLVLGVAGLVLSGCVAAVPVGAPTYTVIPGQGKTEASLRADDAACRGPAASSSAVAAQAAPAVTADQYYQCMASRGEAVVQEQPQAYPAYAYAAPAYVPYAYPAIAAYPYPYYGYGYGYPYGAGYFGPYVGFGVGFGYGGFYGGRGGYGGGFRGGYGGGYGGGFRGGYGGGGFRGGGGGFHGGGGGGFHR